MIISARELCELEHGQLTRMANIYVKMVIEISISPANDTVGVPFVFNGTVYRRVEQKDGHSTNSKFGTVSALDAVSYFLF